MRSFPPTRFVFHADSLAGLRPTGFPGILAAVVGTVGKNLSGRVRNDDEAFAFDLRARRDPAREAPVVHVDHLGGDGDVPAAYAESFAAFIVRFLEER